MQANSDGVIVSAARNELNRMLLENTLVTPTDGEKHLLLNDIVLEAGDKVFIRLNKNGSNAYDAGNGFSVKVTYLEINPSDAATEGTVIDTSLPHAGDFTYSHANAVEHPDNWEFKSIGIADSSISDMVWDAATGAYRVTNDSSSGNYYGYFQNNYSFGTADSRDVAAVFVAPAKVKVKIDIHLANMQANSNGVIVSAARNELNRMLLYQTVVLPSDGEKHFILDEMVLNSGDKVYVRVDSNGQNAYDAGCGFSIKVTYLEINPQSEATVGTILNEKDPSRISEQIQEGSVSISKNSIGQTNGLNGWSHKYITAANKSYPMTFDTKTGSYRILRTMNENSYASFFANGSPGGTADDYDTAIVYTAPVHTKIRFTITTRVENERSDGIITKILRNTMDNKIWPEEARHRIISFTDGMVMTQITLFLGKNEQIFFYLNKNENYLYDHVTFFVTAEYLKLYDTPPEGAQTPAKGEILIPESAEQLNAIESTPTDSNSESTSIDPNNDSTSTDSKITGKPEEENQNGKGNLSIIWISVLLVSSALIIGCIVLIKRKKPRFISDLLKGKGEKHGKA